MHRPDAPDFDPPLIRGEDVHRWGEIFAAVDAALQPIVNIHTGVTVAFEALLRGHRESGFASPLDLLDAAAAAGCLQAIEAAVLGKAAEKLCSLEALRSKLLFFNIDTRSARALVEQDAEIADELSRIGARFGLQNQLVVEVSERFPLEDDETGRAVLRKFKALGLRLAVDDFGAGFSGLPLLHFTNPEYVKIDRYYIDGIDTDFRKRLTVSSTVQVAHMLGAQVVAEGIETEAELDTCRALGCDLAQGYFIQRPDLLVGEAQRQFAHLAERAKLARRSTNRDAELVLRHLHRIPPIDRTESLDAVYARFRNEPRLHVLPVVDKQDPIGVIRDGDLRELIYSPYGRDLLRNPSLSKGIPHFLSGVPVVELGMPTDEMLTLVAANPLTDGLLVTEDGRYLGFLTVRSLLTITHEKGLARDENLLTRLPSRGVLQEWIDQARNDVEHDVTFIFLVKPPPNFPDRVCP